MTVSKKAVLMVAWMAEMKVVSMVVNSVVYSVSLSAAMKEFVTVVVMAEKLAALLVDHLAA